MKRLLLLAIFIASPLMGQDANTSTGQAARPARRQAASPAVVQETTPVVVPATPAVTPETNSIEVKKPEKNSIKSIFSLNYSLGGHDVALYEKYENIGSGDTYTNDVMFQMGGNMEYILGKQWHWYLGAGALLLDYYNLSIHTGFGVTFVDTRNAEGLGWMFDWNILTVGTAYSKAGHFGLMGTSNIRARYAMAKNFGIQMGWDVQVYSLEYDREDGVPLYSLEIYSGLSFGLAFGR